jgi:hypothetical protein
MISSESFSVPAVAISRRMDLTIGAKTCCGRDRALASPATAFLHAEEKKMT